MSKVLNLAGFSRSIIPSFCVRRVFDKSQTQKMLRLHGAFYRPDSFVLMLRYYANLKVVMSQSVPTEYIPPGNSRGLAQKNCPGVGI